MAETVGWLADKLAVDAGELLGRAPLDLRVNRLRAEREAVLHGALARRSTTVQALLRGDALPLDTTSRDLGHHLRDHQTAFVLWQDGQAPSTALGSWRRVKATAPEIRSSSSQVRS